MVFGQSSNLLLRLLQTQATLVQNLEGFADCTDAGIVKTATLQTHSVHAAHSRRCTTDNHIGRHIVGNVRHAPNHRVCADAQELVYTGITAEDGPVIYLYVAGQTGVVGKHSVVANDAVVCNVHIGHKQVVAANTGISTTGAGTAVQCGTFTDNVVVADFEPGVFTGKLFVSR